VSPFSALVLTQTDRPPPAMVPSDNKVALRQLDVAAKNIFQRNTSTPSHGTSIAKDGLFHPRVLTLVSLEDDFMVKYGVLT
jgi:hypothetical protein